MRILILSFCRRGLFLFVDSLINVRQIGHDKGDDQSNECRKNRHCQRDQCADARLVLQEERDEGANKRDAEDDPPYDLRHWNDREDQAEDCKAKRNKRDDVDLLCSTGLVR